MQTRAAAELRAVLCVCIAASRDCLLVATFRFAFEFYRKFYSTQLIIGGNFQEASFDFIPVAATRAVAFAIAGTSLRVLCTILYSTEYCTLPYGRMSHYPECISLIRTKAFVCGANLFVLIVQYIRLENKMSKY